MASWSDPSASNDNATPTHDPNLDAIILALENEVARLRTCLHRLGHSDLAHGQVLP